MPPITEHMVPNEDRFFSMQLVNIICRLDDLNFQVTTDFLKNCRLQLQYANKLALEHRAMYDHYFRTAVTEIVRKLDGKDADFNWYEYDSIMD